jgi:hypothetical protein
MENNPDKNNYDLLSLTKTFIQHSKKHDECIKEHFEKQQKAFGEHGKEENCPYEYFNISKALSCLTKEIFTLRARVEELEARNGYQNG